MNIIEALEKEQLRKDVPKFGPGDTVKVHAKIVEGTRERIQIFEGVVIGRQSFSLDFINFLVDFTHNSDVGDFYVLGFVPVVNDSRFFYYVELSGFSSIRELGYGIKFQNIVDIDRVPA